MHKLQIMIGAVAVSMIGSSCFALTMKSAPEMGLFKKKKKTVEQPVSDYKKLVGSDSVDVKGVMNVVKKDQDFYLEMPVKLMGRVFLVSNKLQRVPNELNEAGVNRGINYENQCVRFEWDKKKKTVFVRQQRVTPEVDQKDAMAASVENNYIDPLIASLKVEAVALNVYELKLNRGMEYQLLVGVGPTNTFYRRVNVTAAPKNVVKITQNGTILALKRGTAVVTAECGGVKAECSVTVGEFETCTIERNLNGVVETNPVGSVVKGMSYQNMLTVADTENFTLVLTAMRLKTTITSGEDGSMNVTEEWVPVDAGCIVTAKDGASAEFKIASVTENIKITANAAAKPVAAMLCADILPVEVKPLKQADGRFRLET